MDRGRARRRCGLVLRLLLGLVLRLWWLLLLNARNRCGLVPLRLLLLLLVVRILGVELGFLGLTMSSIVVDMRLSTSNDRNR